MSKTRKTLISALITWGVVVGASGCASHTATINDLAKKAGYTNIETVHSSDYYVSIVMVRVGQCPVRIYRLKDREPNKFRIEYMMMDDEKYTTLIGPRTNLANAREVAAILMHGEIAEERGILRPAGLKSTELCDATKPYKEQIDKFKY